MSRLGRRAAIVVGLVIVAALSFGVLGRVLGRKRLRFPYLTGSLAPEKYHALAARPGWSASQVSVAPGIRHVTVTSLFSAFNSARNANENESMKALLAL